MNIIRQLLLLLLFASVPVMAQTTQVKASIDSAAVLVGQQAHIKLNIVTDKQNKLLLPFLRDTLVRGVEVLSASPIDTVQLTDTRYQLDQELLITSFDSGFYYIPPFEYVVNSDTFRTNSLSLKVVPYEIDTTAMPFDIKEVIYPPLVWSDYFIYLWWAWAIYLIALLVYLLYKRSQRKKHGPKEAKQAPKLPPHIVALAALESLKEEHVWQRGEEKGYYTRITDILRIYLEDRFGVNAMEMTSSEIITQMRAHSDAKVVLDNLKQVLVMSDFVKFAKLKPLSDENELSMTNALLFVNKTKVEEEANKTEDASSNNPQNNDK